MSEKVKYLYRLSTFIRSLIRGAEVRDVKTKSWSLKHLLRRNINSAFIYCMLNYVDLCDDSNNEEDEGKITLVKCSIVT